MLFNWNESEDRQSSDSWFSSRPHDSLWVSFNFEDGFGLTVFASDVKDSTLVHADANTFF